MMKKRFTKEEMSLHLLLVDIYANEVIVKLTSTSRMLLEKITLATSQTAAVYRNRRPMTVFIRTRHSNLMLARLIQST
jgi:hypothetical protein